MLKKSRAELEKEATSLGLTLDYIPEVVFPNIFAIGEEEWKNSMKDGIGSSGASAALGKSPFKTKEEVVLEKLYGRTKPIGEDPDVQFRLDSGHMQESALLKWYARQLGYQIALVDPTNPSTSEVKDITEITKEEWDAWSKTGFVCVDHARYKHPNYPFIYVDMDGVCFTPSGEMYVLECKTADSKDFKWKWKSGVWGAEDSLASVGNPGYIDQARQHMCVANADRCDIIACCSFNAYDNVIVSIYRDMEEEKRLIDAESDLWEKVTSGELPEFTSLSERSLENVTYVLTDESNSEETIKLPLEAYECLDEIFRLEAEIADLETVKTEREERINGLKATLIPYMGGHRSAVAESKDPGKEIKLELKSRSTSTIDSKRFRLEQPELAAQYTKLTVSDAKLSVKEVKKK